MTTETAPPTAAAPAAQPPTSVEAAVLVELSEGAKTVTSLVAHLVPQLSGRDGLVFPLLLDLRRRGLVAVDWMDVAGVRRAVHRLATDPTPQSAAEPSAPPAPPGERLVEVAEESTKTLAFAPRLREEMRGEILRFLADAVAARVEHGSSPSAAEKDAVRSFGDPWKVGTDLARIAQGRRAVVFPATVGDSLAGIAIYDLRVLLVILAAIVFVRVQVVTAYHIPTKSMEPTLHGDPHRGDRILVNKMAGPPERFDVYVFDGFGTDRKNFVKRCTALPGEKLDLHEGDIWIDGHLVRKDGDAYEALLFEVFDRERLRQSTTSDRDPPAGEKAFRQRMQELWRFEGDGEFGLQEDDGPFSGFRVSAPKEPPPASTQGGEVHPAQVAWYEVPEDSYVDSETGATHPGTHSVPDLRLTVDVKPVPDTNAKVVLRLTRGETHAYEAVVTGDGAGVALYAEGVDVARAAGVALPEGVPTRVSFSQVDRVLRLTVAGRLVLRHDLPEPEFPRNEASSGSAAVQVQRGAAWIDPQRLERDVYYVPDGPDSNFVRLGPDQFFMMGDNSGNSSDSRFHGPVHRSRLIGAPILVVWPPSRVHVPR